ncbi:cold-shock protein [Streptomyces sp. NPDC052396]|uniref:cold-shock protein n=1 Tax=Streptomyces sp. NPDC052396 TaxID=3365689 RepID=UPI0037CD5BCA
MPLGTVKSFDAEKGSGWISPDGGGDDLGVHYSEIEAEPQTLEENQRVAFDVGSGPTGPQAKNVRPAA